MPSWGSPNEMIIFPIVELIRKEVKQLIAKGDITADSFIGGGSNILVQKDESTRKIEYNSSLLAILESNDYELVLEKSNPDRPNQLTGVIIDFGSVKEIINLIRENNKLSYVKINVILREPIETVLTNPFGMSGTDYASYIRNKRLWIYYNDIYTNEESTPEDISAAAIKMNFYHVLNEQLRSIYNVETDLSYDVLLSYLNNPLGMNMYDFIEYMLNKWIWTTDHPLINEDIKEEAHEKNEALREEYGIKEDVGTYDDYKEYLPNPLGMHEIDFTEYMKLKKEYLSLDPNNVDDAARIPINEAEREALLNKYYIYDNYNYEELEEYLKADDDDLFKEKTLLRIITTLNYDDDGKLIGVSSKTYEGET